MRVKLQLIPGINTEDETKTKIRALAIDEKSEVLHKFRLWAQSEPSDHKALLQAMKVAAATKRGAQINPNFVKKSANAAHTNAYEFRSKRGLGRIMFFYWNDVIVCTNVFWKTKNIAEQNTAFSRCTMIRERVWPFLKL